MLLNYFLMYNFTISLIVAHTNTTGGSEHAPGHDEKQ